MYRIRSKFYKTGDMVFISHLDLVRLLERAFRRGNIPISYTQGFNPHPIMAFATALGIGTSSEGEYMDIEVDEKIQLSKFMDSLNMVLPKGLEVITSKYIAKDNKSLMSIIQYSSYTVKVVFQEKMKEEVVNNILCKFLSLEEIIEIKEKKNKNKFKKSYKNEIQEKNIRMQIKNLEVLRIQDNEVVLKMLLATGSSGNLKPETVIKKLQEIMGLQIEPEKTRVHRLELLVEIEPKSLTPLDIAE
ncbi:radical SAM-linked protein [Natronincola peptidivorans]|uniref:Radical SAM-linked protein n=1 Tax=Natronincola peptidivorans TaxID=426128 RepID=A0A1H9YZH2_9FIRM|nr:TIGR03936 family radical SAM-associated protein [Natronincola peptidivorans]SES74666.1 radical SAM-linked protein [Natronincola peptidivorans]